MAKRKKLCGRVKLYLKSGIRLQIVALVDLRLMIGDWGCFYTGSYTVYLRFTANLSTITKVVIILKSS